jgi:hypothetical protein
MWIPGQHDAPPELFRKGIVDSYMGGSAPRVHMGSGVSHGDEHQAYSPVRRRHYTPDDRGTDHRHYSFISILKWFFHQCLGHSIFLSLNFLIDVLFAPLSSPLPMLYELHLRTFPTKILEWTDVVEIGCRVEGSTTGKYNVQTRSGVHSAFYAMDTVCVGGGGAFGGEKRWGGGADPNTH